MHTVAPRPLDRLWLRLKPKALFLAQRLRRPPATRSGTPRGIPKAKASSEDMQRLHRHFDREQ